MAVRVRVWVHSTGATKQLDSYRNERFRDLMLIKLVILMYLHDIISAFGGTPIRKISRAHREYCVSDIIGLVSLRCLVVAHLANGRI